jgi:hypothetical protein
VGGGGEDEGGEGEQGHILLGQKIRDGELMINTTEHFVKNYITNKLCNSESPSGKIQLCLLFYIVF